MNEFLEKLKEDVLPGIWSRGVALSRNLKSVEKLSPSSEKKELKFKIQTLERILAFQVTLWPEDDDSFCNCGSKIEPCHHIVAVALAVSNGQVTEVSQNSQETGARLAYTWVVERDKITLKRELIINGVPQKLEGSLVGIIGGIQSGRLKMPLPSTTKEDLKLDELFSGDGARSSSHGSTQVSWIQVFKAMADLPAMPVSGLPNFERLKVNPKPIRELVSITDSDEGGLSLKKIEAPAPDQRFLNGVVRYGDTLAVHELGPEFQDKVIFQAQYPAFLTDILPRLREHYELEILAKKFPEFTDSEPEIKFKMEPLGESLIVTPEIFYPKAHPEQVTQKDPERERELFREIRLNFGLAPNIPATLQAKEALELRDKLALKKMTFAPVDTYLAQFLNQANVSLADALSQKDFLLKLLSMREKRPEIKSRFPEFLAMLKAKPGVQTEKSPGYLHPPLLPILREYQKHGVEFLNEKRESFGGVILADDMGLGKTIQTLAILKGRNLVIAPTSLLPNWLAEAKRFRPDLSAALYHGSNRSWNSSTELLITSYSILRAEPEKFLGTLWDTVILDEAHLIRNPDTQAAVASFQLSANFRIALTGTPIQNRKRDLLSLFQFIAPGIFEFEEDLDERIVKNFILRRTKAEVLPELPPKTYFEHSIELTPPERLIYQTLFAAAKSSVVKSLDSGENLSPLTLFEVLLRSRQTLNHASLVQGGSNVTGTALKSSSKLTRILEMVEELTESGHSILLYSQWTGFLDILEGYIKDKFKYLRLDGSTKNRGEVVDEFQNDSSPTVFLLSLHAGGVGLNLTRATHVLFCEPWWNPYVELQAEDRAYRLGQEKPVTIHRFTTVDSIEESLNALKLEKMRLGEAVFGKAELLKLLG